MSKTYNISELAAKFDITTRTIRFYEEKGLLTPARLGNNRVYTEQDRVKLQLILRGKRLGFSLEESRDIIEMYDPATGSAEQLQRLIGRIQEKRQALQGQLEDIEMMLVDLADTEQKCQQALRNMK